MPPQLPAVLPPNCFDPQMGMKYSMRVTRITIAAHIKRKLVLKEIALLKCNTKSATKLIGGPGTKGAKQPTNPNIKKTKPISTITTSKLITSIINH